MGELSYSQSCWGISVFQAVHGSIPEVIEIYFGSENPKKGKHIYLSAGWVQVFISDRAWDSVFGGIITPVYQTCSVVDRLPTSEHSVPGEERQCILSIESVSFNQ